MGRICGYETLPPGERRKKKDWSLQYSFWDLDRFETALDAQNGCCPTCGDEIFLDLDGGRSTAKPDHDHLTDKPRGIPCERCNLGFGMFRDDPNKLRMAAMYLEFFRENDGILNQSDIREMQSRLPKPSSEVLSPNGDGTMCVESNIHCNSLPTNKYCGKPFRPKSVFHGKDRCDWRPVILRRPTSCQE